MTTNQMAEIRSWRLRNDGTVAGYVHNDPNDVWEDGEFAVLGPFTVKMESTNFFVFKEGSLTFKAMKDEEKK